MSPQTPQEINEQVKGFCPDLHARAGNDSVARTYLDDWCRLGSFLTHDALVHASLKKLNQRVKKRLRVMLKGMQPDEITLGPNGTLKLRGNVDVLQPLEEELNESEAKENFNRGHVQWEQNVDLQHLDTVKGAYTEKPRGTLVDLPQGVPTLSGFVDPTAFRQILFAHGYHWIDPGAGAAHGAYTHRIQWYCIVEADVRVVQDKSYLSLFRAMSHPLCLAKGGRQALWDLLFDSFKSSSSDLPHSDTYRSPELLNDWLTAFPRLNDADYKCLGYLLRFAKSRDAFDWVGKAAGIEMQNVQTSIGPSADQRVIDQAVGTILWTNSRVRVVDVDVAT